MEQRKNPKMDLRKKAVLFFNVGLVLSLAVVISAFEWRTYIAEAAIVELENDVSYVDEWMPPVTVQKDAEPPKPRPEVFDEIIEVDNGDITEELSPVIDLEPVEPTPSPGPISTEIDEGPEEKVEEEFTVVEVMPEPKHGMTDYLKSIGRKVRYPSQARRTGTEGKVFVQFVIDVDGSIQDAKVVRGIGMGCDKEALRVIETGPKWKPGKQRGVPVRVRMVLPITFQLD